MSDEGRRNEQQGQPPPSPPPPPGGPGPAAPPPQPSGQQQWGGQQGYPQTGPYGYQQYQGGGTYQSGPSGPRATFGQRLVAFLLDWVIVSVPLWLLSALLGASLFSFNFEFNENTGELSSTDVGVGAGAITLWVLVSLALTVGYYVYLEGGDSGQTIGKRAMGIRVLRSDGGPLGYGLATGRYFARFLSQFVCFLGYFWMLWDREKQTWHDKLCSTFVVPTSAYPVQPRS
ncbi:MAG: RDD family protein [Actinomycetota bacterium]